MKTTFLIIITIIVMILLAVRHHYKESKADVPVGTVKVCSTSNPSDCHYVDEKIVNAVYEKALSIAVEDDAEPFPIETIDDVITAYSFTQSDLNTIRDAVAISLKINMANCQDKFQSIHELLVSINKCSKES